LKILSQFHENISLPRAPRRMDLFTPNFLADHSAIISALLSPLNIYRNGQTVWGTESYYRAIGEINEAVRRIKTHDNGVIVSSDLSSDMMEMVILSLKANGKDFEKIEKIMIFRTNDKNLSDLAEALSKNTTVHTVTIHACSVSEQGMVSLAEAFQKNRTIQQLDIGRHNLRKTSTKVLAEGLSKNNAIRSLNIDFSREMGKDGAAALAKALLKNTSLQIGEVFFNKYRKFVIGDENDSESDSESDPEKDD